MDKWNLQKNKNSQGAIKKAPQLELIDPDLTLLFLSNWRLQCNNLIALTHNFFNLVQSKTSFVGTFLSQQQQQKEAIKCILGLDFCKLVIARLSSNDLLWNKLSEKVIINWLSKEYYHQITSSTERTNPSFNNVPQLEGRAPEIQSEGNRSPSPTKNASHLHFPRNPICPLLRREQSFKFNKSPGRVAIPSDATLMYT